ncbi:MAG: tetratricopeptide repeat protein, partial [Planctomycetota bacterium]
QFAQSLAKDLDYLPPERQTNLRMEIELAKTRILKQHQQRLSYWKQALREPAEGMREEALFEINKMNEPEIFEELMQLVQEGTHYFLKSSERKSQQDEYYSFMVQALGSLENPKAGECLWNALEETTKNMLLLEEKQRSFSDMDYIITLAEALKNSKASGYSKKFLKLIDQFGKNSLFGDRTKRIAKKLLQREHPTTLSQPTSSKEYILRAFVKTEMNDLEGAILDYSEALRLNPKEDEAYTKRGILKSNKEDLEGAITDFNETIRLKPRHFEGYLQRGNTKMKKNDLEGAILDYNDALRLNPREASAYKNRGWLKQQQGDFDGGIQDYYEAIRCNPQDYEAYKNIGWLKQQQGDFDGGIQNYNEAIRCNPQDYEAYLNRGIIKYNKEDKEHKEDFDSAIADFTEALRLNPQSAKAYMNRGMMKCKKEDFEGAITDFTEVIRLNPQEATAYFNRMMAYYEKNSYASAKADLEAFENCASPDHPQYSQIPQLRQSLEKIKPH